MKGQMEELTKKVKKLEQASNSNNNNTKGNLQTEEFIPYVEEVSIYIAITNKFLNKMPKSKFWFLAGLLFFLFISLTYLIIGK